MNAIKLVFLVVLISQSLCSAIQSQQTRDAGGIEFYIHEEVTNADGEVEQQLISLWQDYISDGKFEDPNSPYWSFETMKVPDENLWAIGITDLAKRDYKVQCKVIGIFQVEGGYWSLISSFSHIDKDGEIHLDVSGHAR